MYKFIVAMGVAFLVPIAGSAGFLTGNVLLLSPCPGFHSQLEIGMYAQVTSGLPNNIRSQPTTSSALVGSIPGGRYVDVLDGPRCADGVTWWRVQLIEYRLDRRGTGKRHLDCSLVRVSRRNWWWFCS